MTHRDLNGNEGVRGADEDELFDDRGSRVGSRVARGGEGQVLGQVPENDSDVADAAKNDKVEGLRKRRRMEVKPAAGIEHRSRSWVGQGKSLPEQATVVCRWIQRAGNVHILSV